MLELHPEMIGRFTFIQIAAPSRSALEDYQALDTRLALSPPHQSTVLDWSMNQSAQSGASRTKDVNRYYRLPTSVW